MYKLHKYACTLITSYCSMKKLIPIFCFILFSNYSFSQIRKAGNFYELNDLWKRDSIPVKQLINKFNLDLTKLDTIQFFKQFKFNKQLHDEYSHTTYIYTLYKKTDKVTMESDYTERPKPMLNKYVMLICMDDYTDRKIINIQVF
jgi:hypothetical protein